MSGCAYIGRPVTLSYTPSRDSNRIERQTILTIEPFIDKRDTTYSLGKGSSGVPLVPLPLRAKNDVARWVTLAMVQELKANGYRISDTSDWRVGGIVHEASCSAGNSTTCSMRLEIYIRMKDNWQISKRDYRGEGMRPALLSDEDTYELSLQDALRDALTQFKRDLEMTAP